MPDDIAKKFIGRIRSQSARLDTIVNDLIHLSRFDNYALKMELATLDLGVLLRQIHQSKTEDASDADLSFHSAICDTAVEVNGEIKALERWLNLVDNAFKYAAGGVVTLRLYTLGQMGVVEVNNGRFPGTNVNGSLSGSIGLIVGDPETGGTGLGLSIVKHIVQYLPWRSGLSGRQGSTFRVGIPLWSKPSRVWALQIHNSRQRWIWHRNGLPEMSPW